METRDKIGRLRKSEDQFSFISSSIRPTLQTDSPRSLPLKIPFAEAVYTDPGTSLFWNENGILDTIPALRGTGGKSGSGRLGGGAGAGTDVVRRTCLLSLKISPKQSKHNQPPCLVLNGIKINHEYVPTGNNCERRWGRTPHTSTPQPAHEASSLACNSLPQPNRPERGVPSAVVRHAPAPGPITRSHGEVSLKLQCSTNITGGRPDGGYGRRPQSQTRTTFSEGTSLSCSPTSPGGGATSGFS